MNKIFEEIELKDKAGSDLQQAAQLIKQRFDQKRNFYHQMRNTYINVEHWDSLNRKIMEFDADHFNEWNQRVESTMEANPSVKQYRTIYTVL